jgi:site-specific recombinase XerC
MTVLNMLASVHSRRSYKHAIEKFIAWYCSEPRLGFNRAVVVRYRSFLEKLSLSAATINLHLSAIRRLADEAAESGWLSPEVAIGIRRVKGVKRLGRRIGNWLTGDQAQELLNAVSQDTLRGRRDAAVIGLLLGCGPRCRLVRQAAPAPQVWYEGSLKFLDTDCNPSVPWLSFLYGIATI